jgi:VWFA-related protein
MTLKTNGFWSTAMWVAVIAGLSAQAPTPPPAQAPTPAQGQPSAGQSQTPTFRVQIDAVTMDVIVKDDGGRFVSDLTKDEFEIYEDGVRQSVASLTVVSGGRATNVLEAPPPAPVEGVILPPMRRVNDTSGRIFLFFVDDLNLQFQGTGRVRELFKKISKELVHEGDLFGIVSSGPSSIAQDMTYDKKRLDDAIKKMTGDGLKPSEIINTGSGSEGPQELKYRAHVAFSTMLEGLDNLEKVHNRRKALVWVSEGYDFAPFQKSRLGLLDSNSPFTQNQFNQTSNQLNSDPSGTGSSTSNPALDPMIQQQQQAEEFSDAELATDLNEVTRAANRANTTIYTIDPRGLVAGGDIEEQVDTQEWNDYLRKSQDSLRSLAEETGGLAVVNQNDFDKALKRIDAESSDYYVLGYYSSNPDPTKRRRQVAIKVTRPKLSVTSQRTEYVLKGPPRPKSTPPPTSTSNPRRKP